MDERILIAHADSGLRDRLADPLRAAGHAVRSVNGGEAALDALEQERFDALFCAVEAPGRDGFALLPQVLRSTPGISIVLVAPRCPESLRVLRAQRLPADHLLTPCLPEEVVVVGERALARAARRRVARLAEREHDRLVSERSIVAASDRMIALLEQVERVAGTNADLLVTGEKGSGKEVIARAVHAQSPRRGGPFVTVECLKRAETLERELFGDSPNEPDSARPAADGLLTRAGQGTLLLDELTALPPRVQARLVGLLRDRVLVRPDGSKPLPVQVRVIAATRQDPLQACRDGLLVTDLVERLALHRLDVPPLRERREDIPLLADAILERLECTLARPLHGVTDEALERLVAHDWPGNVRELANVLERAALLAPPDSTIGVASLGLTAALDPSREAPSGGSAAQESEAPDLALRSARRAFEADLIRRALARTQGNRTHAARLLEISHRALLYKIKEYGIRD